MSPHGMSESNRHNDMAHTIDIGHVHVGDPDAINRAGTWVCADTCPHPDHAAPLGFDAYLHEELRRRVLHKAFTDKPYDECGCSEGGRCQPKDPTKRQVLTGIFPRSNL